VAGAAASHPNFLCSEVLLSEPLYTLTIITSVDIKPELGKLWRRMACAVNGQFMFTAKLNRAFNHSPIAVVESSWAETIRAGDDNERLAKEGLDGAVPDALPERLLD
jgi:hypothetical protein